MNHPQPRPVLDFKVVLTVALTFFSIMLLGVICRSCETREQSYQQCLTTHEPIQCAASEGVRHR